MIEKLKSKAFAPSKLSLIFNVAFSIYHIAFGVLTESWWLFTLGVYYLLLTVARFTLLVSREVGEGRVGFIGVLLIVLVLPLFGTVILSLVRDRGVVMNEILMIALALYAFTKITVAAISFVKSYKNAGAKEISLRNVSFADAFVSIFALQRSMLVSFGEMAENDIRIMNASLGFAVCVAVFFLGFNLVKNKSRLCRKNKI